MPTQSYHLLSVNAMPMGDFTFNQQFNNLIISSQNVLLCNLQEETVLDRKDIVSYTCVSRNSYIVSRYPYERITMVVAHWWSIYSTKLEVRSLLNKGVRRLIFYEVNGVRTTKAKVVYVGSWKENKEEDTMTFEFYTCWEHQNFKNPIKSDQYVFACGQETKYLFENCFIYPTNVNTATVYHNPTIDNIVEQTTIGEFLQNLCVATRQTVRYWYESGQFRASLSPYGEYVSLAPINVVKVEGEDSDGITEVYVPVATLGTEELLQEFSIITPSSTATNSVDLDSKWAGYKITTVEYYRNNSWVRVDSFVQCAITHLRYTISGGSSITSTLRVWGKKVSISTEQFDDKLTVASILVNNQTKADNIKTKYEEVLGKSKYYTIQGRINPAIEPLDIVEINGVGAIDVEEVSVSYNGAFSGTIKGRFREERLFAPIVVRTMLYDDGDFTFVIKNPNNDLVKLCLETSGADSDVFTMSPKQTLTITQDDCDFITDEMKVYWRDGLYYDIIGYFTKVNPYGDTNVSSSTVIVPYNRPHAPSLESKNTSYPNWFFNIANTNNFDCKLYVVSSNGSEQLIGNVPKNTTIRVNSTDATILDGDMYQYSLHNLGKPLYAYFVNTDDHYLNWEGAKAIILDKNTNVVAPIVVRTWYNSDSDYGFVVNNPNDVALTLYIQYSGGTTHNYSCQANRNVSFSQQYCPELLDSFRQKHNGALEDTVSCYFVKDGDTSISDIILEAD